VTDNIVVPRVFDGLGFDAPFAKEGCTVAEGPHLHPFRQD
jgi:hypothetical protein